MTKTKGIAVIVQYWNGHAYAVEFDPIEVFVGDDADQRAEDRKLELEHQLGNGAIVEVIEADLINK